MTQKERYRAFCDIQRGVPLFMQPYWLDLVCDPVTWDVALSLDEDGAVRGAWAYHTGTRYGFRYVRLPPLTPFTGIWLDIPEDLSTQKQIARRHDILNELEQQLPRVPIFELKVHWSLNDWLPLYWRGYRQETRYTFRFAQPDIDTILENTSKRFRRNLRAAQRYHVIEEGTVSELHILMENVFVMRDAHVSISLASLEHVVHEMRQRGQCKIYAARDMEAVQAIIMTVWDHDTTYYIIGGRRRTDSRHAISLLLCEALRDAARRGHAFDFEGSMIEGINKFFQSFGAQLTPYYYIYRYRALAAVKYMFR